MAIEVHLKKKLGRFALDINFSSTYKRIGILGASGCGKSMTLRGIAGVQSVDEGFVSVEDHVFLDSKNKINLKPQKRKVGYLFQNYALFPNMTVKQNIMTGCPGKKAEKEQKAEEMIKKFQLRDLGDRLPGELSGGQQQRVALARMMAYQPEVILLDEPFSALDEFLKERLQQEIQEMLEDYTGTVILVSHNRDEIYRFSEELLIMDAGQVLVQAPTKEVFANPGTRQSARLTGCKNISDITHVDENHLQISDWACTIETDGSKDKTATAVGYRAHNFVPVWGEKKENCLPFNLQSMSELPFERTYFFKGEGDGVICWRVQREMYALLDEKGMPDFLQIVPDKLLYLK